MNSFLNGGNIMKIGAGLSMFWVAGWVVVSLAQTPAAAPSPTPAARGPSLELSLEAAHTALDTCNARGAKVSVSVIDSGDVLKVLLADDGASKGAVTSSTGKALAARDFKMPTSELAEKMKADKALSDQAKANPDYKPWSGAVPLMVGDEAIGAIGVGGARGINEDEDCARAGLEKIRDRLK
jgi:uncharacterized protein GlcG (DUF336 family)